MDIVLDLVFSALVEWYYHRKRRSARPLPKIVGSVPYVPLKR